MGKSPTCLFKKVVMHTSENLSSVTCIFLIKIVGPLREKYALFIYFIFKSIIKLLGKIKTGNV